MKMFQKTETYLYFVCFLNLELRGVLDREVEHLSGGELQRFAIGFASVRQADM